VLADNNEIICQPHPLNPPLLLGEGEE